MCVCVCVCVCVLRKIDFSATKKARTFSFGGRDKPVDTCCFCTMNKLFSGAREWGQPGGQAF